MPLGLKRFWTISSGKGNVGEKALTTSIGVALARLGRSVIAVDADLGGGNLHTYLGIKSPPFTLLDVLQNRANLKCALLQTCEPGLRMISFAGEIVGMADPIYSQPEETFQFIENLDAEYILVNLGTGTSFAALDFFNMSHKAIVVISPDRSSMQSAYRFIKRGIYRKIQQGLGCNEYVTMALGEFLRGARAARPLTMMDFYGLLRKYNPELASRAEKLVDGYHPLLVIMANSEQDQNVVEILQSASKKFLNVDICFGGLVTSDPTMREAVQQMTHLNLDDQKCISAQQIWQIVLRLLTNDHLFAEAGSPYHFQGVTPLLAVNDNLELTDTDQRSQTVDLRLAGSNNGQNTLPPQSVHPKDGPRHDGKGLVMEQFRQQHVKVSSQHCPRVEELHRHELNRLEQELDATQSQVGLRVNGEDVNRARLEARAADLEKHNRAPRAALVILKEGNDSPIRQSIENFLALERHFSEIRETFQILYDTWRVWPEGTRFSPNPVDPALEAWVSGRRLELEALLKHRFSDAPELVQHLEGCELTASELLAELSSRFYHRAVAKRLDRTLRELQHFHLFGSICELCGEEHEAYQQACGRLRQSEVAARTALTALGVQPIALNLIQRVPEAIVQYICYSEKVHAGAFFSGWPTARELPGGLVLDVVRWAYLNSEGRLWNNTKAQLVVSV